MASRVITRHYDRALAPVGLSTSAYAILSRTSNEGPLPLGALAARLAMDRTTLSRELTPLVDEGLLTAEIDAEDRRRRVVAVTGKALRLSSARVHCGPEHRRRSPAISGLHAPKN
jgi:DNA-binding MarR family transcriptional regulator